MSNRVHLPARPLHILVYARFVSLFVSCTGAGSVSYLSISQHVSLLSGSSFLRPLGKVHRLALIGFRCAHICEPVGSIIRRLREPGSIVAKSLGNQLRPAASFLPMNVSIAFVYVASPQH